MGSVPNVGRIKEAFTTFFYCRVPVVGAVDKKCTLGGLQSTHIGLLCQKFYPMQLEQTKQVAAIANKFIQHARYKLTAP